MFGVPLHFLIVHFPIALAVIAIVYDARGRHDIGYSLTLWAAAGAALAALTGLQIAGGLTSQSEILAHAAAGLLGTIGFIALAVLRYSASARDGDIHTFPVLWLVVEAAAAAAIVAAAFTGHGLGR